MPLHAFIQRRIHFVCSLGSILVLSACHSLPSQDSRPAPQGSGPIPVSSPSPSPASTGRMGPAPGVGSSSSTGTPGVGPARDLLLSTSGHPSSHPSPHPSVHPSSVVLAPAESGSADHDGGVGVEDDGVGLGLGLDVGLGLGGGGDGDGGGDGEVAGAEDAEGDDELEHPAIRLEPAQGSILGGQAVEFVGPQMNLVRSIHVQGHPERRFCEHLYARDAQHLYCFVSPSLVLGPVSLTLEKSSPEVSIDLENAYTFTQSRLEVHAMSLWERVGDASVRFKVYGTGFRSEHLRIEVEGFDCRDGISVLEQGTLAICQMPANRVPQAEERMPFVARVRVSQPGQDGGEQVRELVLERIDFEGTFPAQLELKRLAQGYRVRGFIEGEHLPQGVEPAALLPTLSARFGALRERIFREILIYSRAPRMGVHERFGGDLHHDSLSVYYRKFLMRQLHVDPATSSIPLLWTRLDPQARFLSLAEFKRQFFHGRQELQGVSLFNEANQRIAPEFDRFDFLSHRGYTVETLIEEARSVLYERPELRRRVRQMGGEIGETHGPGVVRSVYNYLWSFVSTPAEEPMPSDQSIRNALVMLNFIQAID